MGLWGTVDCLQRLHITFHTKPTNTHNDLHYKSTHPRYLKNSLPHSKGLRLRRICTKNKGLTGNCTKMEGAFLRCGYYKANLQQQICKAIETPRNRNLKKVTKEESEKIPILATLILRCIRYCSPCNTKRSLCYNNMANTRGTPKTKFECNLCLERYMGVIKVWLDVVIQVAIIIYGRGGD